MPLVVVAVVAVVMAMVVMMMVMVVATMAITSHYLSYNYLAHRCHHHQHHHHSFHDHQYHHRIITLITQGTDRIARSLMVSVGVSDQTAPVSCSPEHRAGVTVGMSQPSSHAEGVRNLCDMRRVELMKHAKGIGVETRRRGTDGKTCVPTDG